MSQISIRGNIGKINYRGPFGGSTTYSGYTVDVMKSALQNIPVKVEMAPFELYIMAEIPRGQMFQTVLYNRLAIISAEDIWSANFQLIISVIQQVLRDTYRDSVVLSAMVQLLAQSENTE